MGRKINDLAFGEFVALLERKTQVVKIGFIKSNALFPALRPVLA
ncbi:hypothetical protein BN341_18820 [Helicobacter heilmannii ASB1.4]|uniref:Uncharacterized protein n=1 Tax=Helicobacter heilmannii TaxID=35817 RepID=A0A0K2Y773_HELHE|nr:hypothetical protein BN341_1440 [Helicobacter heilmannii ASB1.4]CRI33977.1 hypothetical protein HHE01_16630 [Helicobacter heilmannii]CCM73291.1 hypothetical protein BN341_1450 [Helicobacter heilmannii ASB1.4]CCM73299.1 hypothetical protein BN341_1820 [Helicobacter heilmannii ASB1.4]CCM73302.1 hypothetical protein BN341_1860 [Helicobacter heilmannii ASB1.4]